MMESRIYLDNAATTPTDGRVLEAMLPFLTNAYGNASSLHHFGTQAREAVEKARKTLAALLVCDTDEIIFTSGGTEANNMALKGVAFANRHKGNHIIVSSIEHECILNTCRWLETQGYRVSYLPVTKHGFVDPERLEKEINADTILVSVMHANNEIGTIQPVKKIGKICQVHGVYFHSDACQTFGKIPVDPGNFDLLTINAHKIYGPKGIGALVLKKGTRITPLLHGGGQENGLRSSTEHVAGIVGFARAAELCYEEMEWEMKRIGGLRDKIACHLTDHIENLYFNGSLQNRLPNNSNFCIRGLEGEGVRLLLLLDEAGVALSSGSACSSNGGNPASHVLEAIGLNQFEARGSIRISLGRFNTAEEIDRLLDILTNQINKLTSIFTYQ